MWRFVWVILFAAGCNNSRFETAAKAKPERAVPANRREAVSAEVAPSVLAVVLENGAYGFIDKSGAYVLEPKWPLAWKFSEGLAAVNIGGRRMDGVLPFGGAMGGHYGFIDARGDLAIEGPLPNPGLFAHGRLVTMLDREEGAILDTNGAIVARGFAELGGFAGPLSYAEAKDKAGYVDPSGNWVIEITGKSPEGKHFHEGLAPFTRDGAKWGFIKLSGEVAVEPRFDEAEVFWDGRASVRRGDKYGFIDANGQLVGDLEWDWAGPCSEERCAVERDGKYGFVNLEGKVVVEPKYENVRDFHEGKASMQMGGKSGFIDRSGKVVIEPRFVATYDFSQGLALFSTDDLLGYLDHEGNVAIEPRFTKAERFVDVHARNTGDRTW